MAHVLVVALLGGRSLRPAARRRLLLACALHFAAALAAEPPSRLVLLELYLEPTVVG